MATRRPHGSGSVYQDHAKACKEAGTAPKCSCRWIASIEGGWTSTGTRKRPRRIAATKKEARQLVLAMMRSDTPEATTSTTVKSWCEKWLTIAVKSNRPKTYATNRSAVNLWIIPTIGRKRLDKLTPGDVRSVQNAILAAGRTPATAERAHSLLLKILADARSEGHPIPERVLYVKSPGRGEGTRGDIPFADAVQILDVVDKRPDVSRWVAAFLQGMRPAECRGLTWPCVDLEAGVIDVSWQLQALPYLISRDPSSGFRVPTGYVDAYHLVRPKTGKGRRLIPIVPWMALALERWRLVAPANPYGLVWPSEEGRPLEDHADRNHWKALCKEAGLLGANGKPKGVGPYDLYSARHTTATLLRQAGVHDDVITSIMGHASILSTLPYIAIHDVSTRAALNGLADRLGLTAG